MESSSTTTTSGRDEGEDDGGDGDEALARRLWNEVLLATSESFGRDGEVPADLLPRLEWNKRLRVPVGLRQKAQRKLAAHLARVEVFHRIHDAGGEKGEATDARSIRERILDRAILDKAASDALAVEGKLYEGSKSKQIYRNLVAVESNRLKAFPIPVEEVVDKKPDASGAVEKEVGSDPAREFGGDSEDSDIEIALDVSKQAPLQVSKTRSLAREKSLVEMRSRHNREAARQIQATLAREKPVIRELGQVLKIDEDINAGAWAEKIRIKQSHKRVLAMCGLDSSDSDSRSEASLDRDRERDRRRRRKATKTRHGAPDPGPAAATNPAVFEAVLGFIRSQCKLSPTHPLYSTICAKAAKKVMAKHTRSRDASFLAKETKSIQKLLDAYIATYNLSKIN